MSMFALPMDLWLPEISHNSQIRWEIAFCGFTPASYPRKASSHFLYNNPTFPFSCHFLISLSEFYVSYSLIHDSVAMSLPSPNSPYDSRGILPFSLSFIVFDHSICRFYSTKLWIFLTSGHLQWIMNIFSPLIFPHFPSKAVINKL